MNVESAILSSLGNLVLERRADGRFVLRGAPPAWIAALAPDDGLHEDGTVAVEDVFPFLELFLPEAERTWAGDVSTRIDSDGWSQVVGGGEELHLAAVALRLGSTQLLVITQNDKPFEEERSMLQRARELRFVHDALSREIEQKEVLAHCIVHDLSNPLNSMLGTLAILDQKPLPQSDGKLVSLALGAARRQQELIREILYVFAAERGAPDHAPADVRPPDLRAAIAEVAAALKVTARGRRVRIAPALPPTLPAELPVAGDEMRLQRVLGNLVENAIRYSPVGGVVRITVTDADAALEVGVEDQGAGVPPQLVPHLFQKFARARSDLPGTGLGLYFCRITVERWGGTIGYAARAGGGSRFWLRLPKAD